MAKPIPKKKKKGSTAQLTISGYDPKLINQRMLDQDIFENMSFDPKLVPNFYVSNIVNRVLARMAGQGPYGPVAVKCTEDGSLAVVPRGGAFDDYEIEQHDFTPAITSTATATLANHLVDAAGNFVVNNVQPGDAIFNTTDGTYAVVTARNSATDLTLDTDIMTSGKAYKLFHYFEFTFSQQVTRIDLFTYDTKVDYQLTRDDVKPYGAKIELFSDSFYSLDFYTLKVKATPKSISGTTYPKSKIMGWFREGG